MTWVPEEEVPSPYAANASRKVATCIYYLLTADGTHGVEAEKTKNLKGWSSSTAKLHINKSPVRSQCVWAKTPPFTEN